MAMTSFSRPKQNPLSDAVIERFILDNPQHYKVLPSYTPKPRPAHRNTMFWGSKCTPKKAKATKPKLTTSDRIRQIVGLLRLSQPRTVDEIATKLGMSKDWTRHIARQTPQIVVSRKCINHRQQTVLSLVGALME